MRMNDTVDGVAERVRALLESGEGKERIGRFNKLAARVEKSIPTLMEMKKKLHQRARMQLYINVADAQHASDTQAVRMSVRVHGCKCGTVRVDSDGKRTFTPSNPGLFERYGYDEARGLEWGDAPVADFIKRCVEAVDKGEVKTGKPEASVEAKLIARMKLESGGWWCQKPVCLAGIPLQIPLPIAAAGPEPKLGDGHIDVLARLGRGGKGLRVYEIKAPRAGVETALDQAVGYMAALKVALTQTDTSAGPWWTLIGFSKRPKRTPRFEAVACVADNTKNREQLEKACKRLEAGNHENIVVGAVFYSYDASGRLRLRPRRTSPYL